MAIRRLADTRRRLGSPKTSGPAQAVRKQAEDEYSAAAMSSMPVARALRAAR